MSKIGQLLEIKGVVVIINNREKENLTIEYTIRNATTGFNLPRELKLQISEKDLSKFHFNQKVKIIIEDNSDPVTEPSY